MVRRPRFTFQANWMVVVPSITDISGLINSYVTVNNLKEGKAWLKQDNVTLVQLTLILFRFRKVMRTSRNPEDAKT